MSAPLSSGEDARLHTLRRYAVMDTPPEAGFDLITRLAASLFETPVALVSLIDEKRQWFKSCVGFGPAEVDREIAFCAHAILSDDVLIVPDTLEDARFRDNPQVAGAPFIRFYAGAPLVTPHGFRLGTLCVVDMVPRTFSSSQTARLQQLAAMVMETLETRRASATMKAALESTSSGMVICDPAKPNLPIVFVNPAFCAITGYRAEEVLGRNCRFLQGPDTDPTMLARMREALAERRPFHGTLRNYRKDGTSFWNALSINPVFDDFGELISFVGVQVDTTAQVDALEQTRQSEARFAVAQRVAKIGSWECAFTAAGELDQKSVIWSDETFRLVGLAREDGADVWAHFYRCLPPGEVELVNSALDEAIRTRGRYSLDHRFIRPDGTARVLHEEASILLDEATGEPARIVGTMQDITERKAAEDALRISEENHRAFFDANPLPSWVFDLRTLAFLEVNPAAVAHYGYSREEFLAMTIRDLRPPGSISAPLAESPSPGADPVRLSHCWHRKKDGSLIEVEISGGEVSFAGRPARLSVAHDVTERRRAEFALRESEARFSGAFTHSPIGTALVSPQGRWLRVNPALCKLTGYSETELLTRSFQDITHPDDLERDREMLRRMTEADLFAVPFERRYIHADGHVITVLVTATLVYGQGGEPSHWVSQIQDITDRKQAEKNRLAMEEAERSNKEKSRFLSRMSHELRTPLNAILGFGQVLEFSKLGKQDAQALGYILKGGQHLLSLIDEVLDLSRAESGELRLAITSVDAVKVTRECVDLIARLAEARNLHCAIKDPRGNVMLWCDEQRLRQMLLNLLSNAIKYNREGGKIVVGFEPVSGHRLRVNITDTGPGIPPDGIARLFMPFERLQHESGEVEGTGLGLVVSRRIAEAMDGAIGLASEVGRGSTFWIELPLAATPTTLPIDNASVSAASSPGFSTRQNTSLLYIEDNLSNLQLMQMLLGRQRPHWQFISARDGREGLEQARQTSPEVILLDLQLPGISGEEVLTQLCAGTGTRDIPVVVLSADATTHSREHLLALGAKEYVSKPFQVEPFLALLDHVLRREKQAKASVSGVDDQ